MHVTRRLAGCAASGMATGKGRRMAWVRQTARRAWGVLGRHRAEIAWCLWFAALLGLPYLDSGSLLHLLHQEAYGSGALSFSSVYGFVALGLLLGLWVASYPTVNMRLSASRALRRGCWVVGLVVTVLLLGATTGLFGELYGAVFAVLRGAGVLGLVTPASPMPFWAQMITDALNGLDKVRLWADAVALLASFACGVCAWACLAQQGTGGDRGRSAEGEDAGRGSLSKARPGRGSADARSLGARDGLAAGHGCGHGRHAALLTWRNLRLVALLSLVIGLVRGFAWSVCLPHPDFPLPLSNAFRAIYPDQLWGDTSLALIWLPFALMLATGAAVALLAWAMRRGAGSAAASECVVLATLAPLCAGELVFRLVGRVCPTALGIGWGVAVACLIVQVVAVVGLVACAVGTWRGRGLVGYERGGARRGSRAAKAPAGPAADVSVGAGASSLAAGVAGSGATAISTPGGGATGAAAPAGGDACLSGAPGAEAADAGWPAGHPTAGSSGNSASPFDAGSARPATGGAAAAGTTTAHGAATADAADVAGLRALLAVSLPDVAVVRLTGMGLTDNEINAVRARVAGLTSRQASAALGIQPSTVRAYGRRACTKAGVPTLDELVARLGIEHRAASGERLLDLAALEAGEADAVRAARTPLSGAVAGPTMGEGRPDEGPAGFGAGTDAEAGARASVGAASEAGMRPGAHAPAGMRPGAPAASAADACLVGAHPATLSGDAPARPAAPAGSDDGDLTPGAGSDADISAAGVPADRPRAPHAPADRAWRALGWAACVLALAGTLAAGLLLLLPYGVVASAWGMVWETAFGAGLGLIGWLVAVHGARYLRDLRDGRRGASGLAASTVGRTAARTRRGHHAACVQSPSGEVLVVAVQLVGLVGSALALRWCQGRPIDLGNVLGGHSGGWLLVVGVTCLFTAFCLACLDRALAAWGAWEGRPNASDGQAEVGGGHARAKAQTRPRRAGWPAALALALAGAVCSLATLGPDVRRVLLASCLLAAAVGLLGATVLRSPACSLRRHLRPGLRSGGGGPLADLLARPMASGLGALTLVLVGVAPLAWEELWRSRTFVSLADACLPFALALGVFGICWLWVLHPRTRLSCVACAAFACVLGVCEGALFGLVASEALLVVGAILTGGLTSAGSRAASSLEGIAVRTWAWHAPALTMGAGCFAAVYVVNLYGTQHYRQATMYRSPFGGQVGYEMLVTVIVAALLLVLAGAWMVALVMRERDARVARLVPTPSQMTRLRGYLVGRGLRELEVEVALLTASGASAAQIAQSLSYAPSSVATARREAYRKLGVHARDQLVIVLQTVLTA